jgi:predicted phage baseplate assembly protein
MTEERFMPLQPPNLDNRSFEEVKRLAILRIPRYTQEWTDFNESDPGITLIELFAWLTEMMQFQMNQVPERNYLKFLQLLGMELRAAQPATAHLTFAVQPGSLTDSVPQRAQVSAQPPGGGDQLIFETTAGLDLIRLPLTRVLVLANGAFSDVTSANNTPGKIPIRPFSIVPQVGNALYLGFSIDPQKAPPSPYFPQEMRFHIFLPAASQAGQPDMCRNSSVPAAPPAKLVWEYVQKGNPPHWARLQIYGDESNAFTREGAIQVQGPGSDFVPSVQGMGQVPFYWLRIRLDSSGYPAGRAPTIDFIRPNVVAAENLSTIKQEVVGTSQGTPSQTFTVRRKPVIADSLSLLVQQQNPPDETWQRKDDFLASSPDALDYVLNSATGEIRFGDGRNGRIPVAGSQIIAASYRYGGGAAGNVAANLITQLTTNVQGVQSVTNERRATGGRDEQSMDDFKKQAPAVLRHRNRAVSADDFRAFAAEAGGIAKATAIPLMHPDYPGVKVPGAITVVVVPDNDDVPPKPSQEQLDRVCEYLDSRRLLTTELATRGPEFHAIKVQARVAANPYAAFDKVAQAINSALNAYLDPLGRKPASAPATWRPGSDFGLDLFPTSLYDILLDVDDVRAVRALSLTVDGVPHDNLNEPISVPEWGMVYGVPQHDIRVEPFTQGR